MRYEYKSSFQRSFKKLAPSVQREVQFAHDSLLDFFDKRPPLSAGLGLKRIGKNYWEIRAGLKTRILFALENDLTAFYFVGNHDQIKKFIHE